MSKKVTMFIWNEFYNDSRVLRECTALIQGGYEVNLIALGKAKSLEKRMNLFSIYRLTYKNAEFNYICIFFSVILFIYFSDMSIVLMCILAFFLITCSKLKFFVRKIVLIFKMIFLGLRLKTDVYHANDLNTLVQATVCAKLKKRKLIFDSHEINTSRSGYDSWIYPFLEKVLIKVPNIVIHENHTRAQYIEEIYGFRPEVIYNYPYLRVDKEKVDMHKLLGIEKDELLFIYQGGLQEGRGLEQLVDAVPLINKGTVVFIGDGKIKEKLVQETRLKKLEDRIKFIDKVPVEILHLYTRNAYLGFQLLNNTCYNHFSAASNKLFEYMMAGVPVIGCSFPEIKKIIKGEKTGLIIDSSDYRSIAQAVNFLVDHREIWEQLRNNSLKARMKYNWEYEQVNLLKIYASLDETC